MSDDYKEGYQDATMKAHGRRLDKVTQDLDNLKRICYLLLAAQGVGTAPNLIGFFL